MAARLQFQIWPSVRQHDRSGCKLLFSSLPNGELPLTLPQRPRYYKASFFEYVNAFKVYGGYEKD
jgi:hypothetical protein